MPLLVRYPSEFHHKNSARIIRGLQYQLRQSTVFLKLLHHKSWVRTRGKENLMVLQFCVCLCSQTSDSKGVSDCTCALPTRNQKLEVGTAVELTSCKLALQFNFWTAVQPPCTLQISNSTILNSMIGTNNR